MFSLKKPVHWAPSEITTTLYFYFTDVFSHYILKFHTIRYRYRFLCFFICLIHTKLMLKFLLWKTVFSNSKRKLSIEEGIFFWFRFLNFWLEFEKKSWNESQHYFVYVQLIYVFNFFDACANSFFFSFFKLWLLNRYTISELQIN